MLKLKDGETLVALARDAIASFFSHESLNFDSVTKYSQKQGAFVTLYEHNALRGQLGYPAPHDALYQTVYKAARGAAFEDPRFPKLTPEELTVLQIEIAVLSHPQKLEVGEAEEYLPLIKIGRDGLIVQAYHHTAVLLPQVFIDAGCSPHEALRMVCAQAGMTEDAWTDLKHVSIYVFQTQVFREQNGTVVEIQQLKS